MPDPLLTGDRTLSTDQAAVLLARADDPAGVRLRRAVDSSLARHGLTGADRDDARAEVALALLTAPRRVRLELDAACALAARIARNKAVDQHRRRQREAPDEPALEHVAAPVEGRLAHDLDAVAGEAHRRAVRVALAGLLGELPPAERHALHATADGSGAGGSGLGRSSHYRALERARQRLVEPVRARIAGGLALPFALLRALGVARDGGLLRAAAGPVAVLVTAAAASIALVLPATRAADAPPVRATPSLHAPRAVVTVPALSAPRPAPAPLVRSSPRHGATAVVRVRHPPARVGTTAQPRRHAAPAHRTPVQPARQIDSTPDAGLAPCRAAQLCS